jgi:hypothetical protein
MMLRLQLPVPRERGFAGQVSDKAKKHWSTAHQARPDDPGLEEVLPQLGSDILNEPIPERLLQALQSKRGQAEAKSKRRN